MGEAEVRGAIENGRSEVRGAIENGRRSDGNGWKVRGRSRQEGNEKGK